MYLTHKNLASYFVGDIETDSLTPTKIHCAVFKNLGSKNRYYFYDGEEIADYHRTGCVSDLGRWYDTLDDNSYLIGHNFLSFDAPALNRLAKTRIRIDQIIDTLILSTLYDPKLLGGHSLEAWGDRIGVLKGSYNDWSQFSPDMLKYCEQDVNVTELVFLKLTKRMRELGFSEKSCQLEHEIRHVVNKQERNGFYFDIPRAERLLAELRQLQSSLAEPVQRLFPPALVPVKTLKYKTTKSGSPHKNYSRHLLKYPRVELQGSEYTCYDWKEFNLGSPQQRYEKLLELGWKPEEMGAKRTKTGKSWQVDEEALEAFSKYLEKENPSGADYKALQALSEWVVISGRGNMVQTWLDFVSPLDSCIHGTVWTCGARTRRMTHTEPNTANIPKAKKSVRYGKECRELWRARPNRVLVGYDAKSLEMLCFCHYLNDPCVTELYLDDPHTKNAETWGNNPWGKPVERDGPPGAKTGFYAGLYGAQDKKLGASIWIGGTTEMGSWARQRLMETTPGLERILEEVEIEFKTTGGLLRTIDGGFARCHALHAAFNTKCQSAGGIVMKQASIFIDRRCRDLDHLKVGDIHDEGQHDVNPKDAEQFGKLAISCIRDAGEELNFNVKLDGDYKIGDTWAQTH